MNRLSVTMLTLFAACTWPETAAKPPGDADSLVAGTYSLTIYRRSQFLGRPAATGTLVLLDSVIPSQVSYWGLPHLNGCLTLRGELQVLSFPPTTRDSVAVLTQWSRDTSGWLKLPAFTGVDSGYWVEFVVRRPRLRGAGRSLALGLPASRMGLAGE